MHKLIVTLIAVHFVLTAVGQQSDYLKSILDELPDTSVLSENVTPVRAYLPIGFARFPSNGYVGISDPMMPDTLKAFQQAYLRAVMMYAIREGKGKGLTDFYTDERDGTNASVYQEFVLLKSQTSFPVHQFDVQSFQLGSGEFVVVLSLRNAPDPVQSSLQFSTRIEHYSKEVVSGGIVQSYSKLSIQQQLRDTVSGIQNQESVEYQFSNTNRIAMRSSFNGVSSEPGKYRFFYYNTDEIPDSAADSIAPSSVEINGNQPESVNGNQPETVTGNESTSVTGNQPTSVSGNQPGSVTGALTFSGLWFAAMADLFGQVTNQFQFLSTKVARVGDQYQSLALSLNRETGEFTYRLNVDRWRFFDNKLRLTIE